jgi:hypothetical protein
MNNKPKWEKWEEELAKDFGQMQVGSGRVWNKKGDVKNQKFLIEAKQTDNKSFSITETLWDKIYGEALDSFRLPMMGIKIKDTELVVLDKEDFKNLLQSLSDICQR